MNPEQDIVKNEELRKNVWLQAELAKSFFPTEPYQSFRDRLHAVMEARDYRLKIGLFEQKGGALIGPSGAGKSRMVSEAIADFHRVAEATGGREFGHQIVSVIVPGRATPKETAAEILRTLGYPVKNARDEDYFFNRIKDLLKHQRVAGLHLDEVQDAGRHTTDAAKEHFTKRFRNLTQDKEWPVCLFLSATLEAREFINHDNTLARRLNPIEIRPISASTDGNKLRESVGILLRKSGIADQTGLMVNEEFMQILMHAAAYRFGLAIEITIEAIGEAIFDGVQTLELDHFAGAYFARTNNDDDLNPFMTPHWRGIDTTKVMDRGNSEEAEARKKDRRKK
jgi:hypothetical protein